MAEKWNDKLPDNAFLTGTDTAYEKGDIKNYSIKTFYKSLKPRNA